MIYKSKLIYNLNGDIEVKKYGIVYFFTLFYTAFDAFAYFGAINSLGKFFLYLILLFLVISLHKFDRRIVFLIYCLLCGLIINFFIDTSSIFLNFKALIRILNPFLIFMVFSKIARKNLFFSEAFFLQFFRVFYIFTYLSLLLGKFTGIGQSNSLRFGMKNFEGFFKGANEIGILLIIILIYLFFLKNRLYKLEILVILFANIVFGYFVFTKSAFMAAFFSFLFINIYFKFIRNIVILFFFALFFVSFATETVFTKAFREILDKSEYIKVLSTSFIHFIFNSREIYFVSFFDHFEINFISIFQLCLIGLGDYGVIQRILPGLSWITETDINIVGRASFEMDFFDLFFGYGLLFTVMYLFFVYKYVKTITKHGGFLVGLLLFSILVHAFLAGHVFFSTQITGPLMLLYFFVNANHSVYKRKVI